ncbi:hypothetical protein KY312_00560, partial [Candidatus Woesearchaeota archaeon]|nr:hypothetical protein [Candidatus Woesearchaeota archaeon]
ILGIFVISLLIVIGVYALGPHTRFTHLNEQCIYYYGSGACEVEKHYCDPSGANYHIMLDRSQCIGPEVNIGKPVPKVPQPQVQQPVPVEPVVQQPLPPQVTVVKNYLWLIIPIVALFAALVAVWVLYYETKLELVHEQNKHDITLCPRCGATMKRTGQLKQGPRQGLRQTYVCSKCGHRTMRNPPKK